MSKFPKVEQINGLEVTFFKINNREKSRIKRLWAATTGATMLDIKDDLLSEEELKKLTPEEVKRYEDNLIETNAARILAAFAHENYDIVRDMLFKNINIKGVGNALDAIDGFDDCYDNDESLEGSIFQKAMDLYSGNSKAVEVTE